MACCTSNFTSSTYNIPDCNINCLSAAERGAIFIGADDSIWIFNGDDPCSPSGWQLQSSCIRFYNAEAFTDICRNEAIEFTSDDETVVITITEGKIDFSTGHADPLPVANFSYETGGLSGSVDATSSSSTQEDVTITYLWSYTGPGTLTFSNDTAIAPTFTVSIPGEYEVTLTITDSNGNTATHTEVICVLAKDACDVLYEIPDEAFANINAPTDAEALIYINANGPYNCKTLFWFGGTETAPNYIWLYQ